MSFDPATNRLNSAGWDYDAAGNQTRARGPAGGWLRFKYDAANRLAKVTNDFEQALASYTYGAGRRRLVTQHGAETSNLRTYYVWGAEEVLAEFAEDDTSPTLPKLKRNYVYLSSTLIATQEFTAAGESVEYHHPDQLSTRLVTKPSADTSFTSFEQATLPFGNDIAAESTGVTDRRFTSYDRSRDTGLDYAVNRTYDAAQGRFTQVDPAGMRAADLFTPQSLNLYAYCVNDPVNLTDGNGLWPSGNVLFPLPFPGGGGGGLGGFLGGLLGGFFNFGLGFVSWVFSRPSTTFQNAVPLNRSFLAAMQALQRPTPQPPPTSVTVALSGVYSERYENYLEQPGSSNFMYGRALSSVGGKDAFARTFRTGMELLERAASLSAQVNSIGRMNIFAHAYPPGLIGYSAQSMDWNGLYIGNGTHPVWRGRPPSQESVRQGQAATAEQFAEMILGGQINIAEGGEIVFFGCNTDALASHLQFMLRGRRPDIRVTGATGNVTMENPTYAETGPGRFNTWTGPNHDQVDGRRTRRRYR